MFFIPVGVTSWACISAESDTIVSRRCEGPLQAAAAVVAMCGEEWNEVRSRVEKGGKMLEGREA